MKNKRYKYPIVMRFFEGFFTDSTRYIKIETRKQCIPIFFRRENVRDFLHVKRMDKKKKMLSSTIFQKEKSLLGTRAEGHMAISGRGNM